MVQNTHFRISTLQNSSGLSEFPEFWQIYSIQKDTKLTKVKSTPSIPKRTCLTLVVETAESLGTQKIIDDLIYKIKYNTGQKRLETTLKLDDQKPRTLKSCIRPEIHEQTIWTAKELRPTLVDYSRDKKFATRGLLEINNFPELF